MYRDPLSHSPPEGEGLVPQDTCQYFVQSTFRSHKQYEGFSNSFADTSGSFHLIFFFFFLNLNIFPFKFHLPMPFDHAWVH